VRWDPPGPGTWWLELEHFPRPVSRLFADLFPPVTAGWSRGARRYGDNAAPARWGTSNDWLYYGPPDPPPPDPTLDGVAARARAESWWRDEVRRWHDEERPRVVATNLALQHEDLAALDDAALTDHVRRAFEHYSSSAPLHFEHAGNHVCNDVLRDAAAAAGFPDLDIATLTVGSSPASSRPAVLIGAIADALTAAGVRATAEVASLDDVRAASPDAARALDAYLDEYGFRLVESYDPAYPALLEQPSVIVRSIQACLSGHWRGHEPTAVDPEPPWGTDARLDELLADARALHAVRDDDDGTCFFWPMGLVRRAVLEAGGRLVAQGRVVAATDLFDATTAEILDVLEGAPAPDARELSRRAQARAEAGAVVPPASLGDGGRGGAATAEVAAEATGHPSAGVRRWTGTAIGTGVGRGRVRRHRTGDDVLGSIEPGDVLVAVTTTPAFNTVFPLLAAVITETGSVRSHAALLSRELGLPAIVGVAGAMSLPDGALVEVDGDAGVCTLLTSS
jgi:pyruvate,water dikinase